MSNLYTNFLKALETSTTFNKFKDIADKVKETDRWIHYISYKNLSINLLSMVGEWEKFDYVVKNMPTKYKPTINISRIIVQCFKSHYEHLDLIRISLNNNERLSLMHASYNDCTMLRLVITNCLLPNEVVRFVILASYKRNIESVRILIHELVKSNKLDNSNHDLLPAICYLGNYELFQIVYPYYNNITEKTIGHACLGGNFKILDTLNIVDKINYNIFQSVVENTEHNVSEYLLLNSELLRDVSNNLEHLLINRTLNYKLIYLFLSLKDVHNSRCVSIFNKHGLYLLNIQRDSQLEYTNYEGKISHWKFMFANMCRYKTNLMKSVPRHKYT
jgi:hypothetical protein